VTEPTYDACIVEAELRARAAYGEPHRRYHDERHLEECLRELDSVPDLDERDRRLLRWAILWHDAIYEPGLSDNEERSAELAERELTRCGVAPGDAGEVARLVRLTAKHRVESDDGLGALLVSIDLAILGSDSERYWEYVGDVRDEYAHVPALLWRTGRAEVLKRLLAADPIFPAPAFRERFEIRARRNMQTELNDLTAG
jgi:predicted metal-dependent HD superfamily phosphohydrolase